MALYRVRKKSARYRKIMRFFKFVEIHDTYIMFFQALRINLPMFSNVKNENS